MTTAAERATRRELAELRRRWRTWKTGLGLFEEIGCHGGHPALYSCGHTSPEPGCEGCCSRRYRADRRAQIETQATEVKASVAN